MPAYIFTDILSKATQQDIKVGTQRARQFFRREAKSVRTTPSMVMRPDDRSKLTSRPTIGRMYFFNYDPKLKRQLPYYDRFPLIFMIGPAEGGFYGINLHYLAPTFRARLMDALYDTVTNQNYDESTRLKISYDILKKTSKFRYFKPCIKHYLANKVQGRFLEVSSNEWDIALFLPVERFEKANKRRVFNDSQRKF